jgi:hypothetical protein
MRRRITKGRVNISLAIEEISTRQKKYTEYILHTMSVTRTDYNTAKKIAMHELGFNSMRRQMQII